MICILVMKITLSLIHVGFPEKYNCQGMSEEGGLERGENYWDTEHGVKEPSQSGGVSHLAISNALPLTCRSTMHTDYHCRIPT